VLRANPDAFASAPMVEPCIFMLPDLVPSSARSVNYEPLDGSIGNCASAREKTHIQ
jgi:hypothetical protein